MMYQSGLPCTLHMYSCSFRLAGRPINSQANAAAPRSVLGRLQGRLQMLWPCAHGGLAGTVAIVRRPDSACMSFFATPCTLQLAKAAQPSARPLELHLLHAEPTRLPLHLTQHTRNAAPPCHGNKSPRSPWSSSAGRLRLRSQSGRLLVNLPSSFLQLVRLLPWTSNSYERLPLLSWPTPKRASLAREKCCHLCSSPAPPSSPPPLRNTTPTQPAKRNTCYSCVVLPALTCTPSTQSFLCRLAAHWSQRTNRPPAN
ncbi:hypothetical protein BDV95DRAFT_16976 [Massariosphaeria phaeospora]|uniref:Uncharacterized protein n=1 Tax=Massariosphaeria phaeospora TaxID=100035 RepID=A0A7C8IRI5_9PLEO|nr:hypothetical protein BDV95DRAFT_16976 [Massariosphaeria phaeospora]